MHKQLLLDAIAREQPDQVIFLHSSYGWDLAPRIAVALAAAQVSEVIAVEDGLPVIPACNAKLRRTGVCGATESLLIDLEIAAVALPQLLDAMPECEFRGDTASQKIDPRVVPANPEDWGTEYLAPVVSVKTVSGLEEAIAHINEFGSGHTDAILTTDEGAAQQFLSQVDSAIVLHNASTQFADGGEFGMGAEIGIATGRLHARGPVGVEQLTTYKYQVHGDGQTRPG